MLRKSSRHPAHGKDRKGGMGSFVDHASSRSLKWRIAMLTASLVAIAVGLMTIVAYWSVNSTLRNSMDIDLNAKAEATLSRLENSSIAPDAVQKELQEFRRFNPNYKIAVTNQQWPYAIGDTIAVAENATVNEQGYTADSLEGMRVLTKEDPNTGTTVIVARQSSSIKSITNNLGFVLLGVSVAGILLAVVAGIFVANTGLRPVIHLRNAVRRVTETDKLTPIPVEGQDEIAQLTCSFNEMLAALDSSRARQAELVADAGHELKTPLTSMRTNIELLMMMYKSDSPHLSIADREALEADVIAQMEELSTLIGDLVDLAREQSLDKTETLEAEVNLEEVVEHALERVQRRRTDVTFDISVIPWCVVGDYASLNRAFVNVLDNAAKWSPQQGTVRLEMEQTGRNTITISVSDSGPGVPEADRERIFERFYRSVEARAMPGSGLGLAIVRQVMVRHGGSIVAKESNDGGTKMVMTLPGFSDAPSAEHTQES
ncbi:HAMP domain-containing histidine kinase [Corynebacterium sp. 35RC1]|nr:HAMP domain-containing histidine kinase [Corynebacterium sp. 35RC1]